MLKYSPEGQIFCEEPHSIELKKKLKLHRRIWHLPPYRKHEVQLLGTERKTKQELHCATQPVMCGKSYFEPEEILILMADTEIKKV